jgi:hypothetical protein
MMDISLVLTEKYPNTEWVLRGAEYSDLEWLDDSPKPTKKALEKAWPEAQHARAVKAVEAERAVAYREEADPLFFRYQAGEATREEWEQARQNIRDRFPYPEGP